MSLPDASNRVLDQSLSSDEITKDAYVFSFPMPDGYGIYSPEHAALDGTWTPLPFESV
jgi:hypothetical protein